MLKMAVFKQSNDKKWEFTEGRHLNHSHAKVQPQVLSTIALEEDGYICNTVYPVEYFDGFHDDIPVSQSFHRIIQFSTSSNDVIIHISVISTIADKQKTFNYKQCDNMLVARQSLTAQTMTNWYWITEQSCTCRQRNKLHYWDRWEQGASAH